MLIATAILMKAIHGFHPTGSGAVQILSWRIFGVLAPNSPLRAHVTAMVGQKPGDINASSKPQEKTPVQNKPDNDVPKSEKDEKRNRPLSCYLWAELLARVFGIIPTCPNCGKPMRVIAFIQSNESLYQILTHVGLPTKPPEISPARGPPGWRDVDQISAFDDSEPQFEPEFEFDQTVNW